MGWRRRLVLWLRDVTTTYGLSAGTFASAIAVSGARGLRCLTWRP